MYALLQKNKMRDESFIAQNEKACGATFSYKNKWVFDKCKLMKNGNAENMKHRRKRSLDALASDVAQLIVPEGLAKGTTVFSSGGVGGTITGTVNANEYAVRWVGVNNTQDRLRNTLYLKKPTGFRITSAGTLTNHADGLASLTQNQIVQLTDQVLNACVDNANNFVLQLNGTYRCNVVGIGNIIYNLVDDGRTKEVFHFDMPNWAQMAMH